MRKPLFLLLFLFILIAPASGQRKRQPASKPIRAIVIDNTLAVVRNSPGFYGQTLRRLRRGRGLIAQGTRVADGATFVRVAISSRTSGWIQREAVAVPGVAGEDERLLRLIIALKGFDQIEAARIFLNEFPASAYRPRMLLLFGDLIEETAGKLSVQAAKRLDRQAMAASGGPIQAFYLNFSGIDRYRKIGINFFVNPRTRKFHYSGAAWRELLQKYPNSEEMTEAKKRLSELDENLRMESP
jgi:hypothetical protein